MVAGVVGFRDAALAHAVPLAIAPEVVVLQVARLGTPSQEIGNVVKVITSLAEQTDLLALNATIEAAIEDIARRVEAIQADTTGAVGAIGEIAHIIASINDYQLTIARR